MGDTPETRRVLDTGHLDPTDAVTDTVTDPVAVPTDPVAGQVTGQVAGEVAGEVDHPSTVRLKDPAP